MHSPGRLTFKCIARRDVSKCRQIKPSRRRAGDRPKDGGLYETGRRAMDGGRRARGRRAAGNGVTGGGRRATGGSIGPNTRQQTS